MDPDILIIHDRDGYRLLHGHLHLVSTLSMTTDGVKIDVRGVGPVAVVRNGGQILVEKDGRRLPLLRA